MERKEAYRLYFLVKGHINVTDDQAYESANGYFARVWREGADGAPIYEYDELFEIAWADKIRHESNSI